jgi:hypothetical protein
MSFELASVGFYVVAFFIVIVFVKMIFDKFNDFKTKKMFKETKDNKEDPFK